MNNNQQIVRSQEARSGFYYGYIVAIAAFFIFIVVQGIHFSFGVFFTPMVTEMGWSNATTSLAYSISTIMEGLLAFASGGLTDRYGPRLTLTISGFLLGLGYCLMPLVQSTWQLYLFFGVIIGVGRSCIYVPLISEVIKWFKSKRSFVVGIVGCGISIGILVIAPLATRMMENFNWRNTFFILGIFLFLTVIVAAQFLKRAPLPPKQIVQNEAHPPLKANSPGYSFKDICRTNQFWLAFFIFFCFTFVSFTMNIFIVPDAIRAGISPPIAATVLSTYGGLQIVGRIGLGSAADKIGNRNIYIMGFPIVAAALFLIIFSNSLWSFYLFAAIFGIIQGGLFTSQAPLVASLFGSKSLGFVLGLTGIGFTLGAAIGPYSTGRIFDSTGSYNPAFIISVIISLTGLVLILLLKPINNHLVSSSKFNRI